MAWTQEQIRAERDRLDDLRMDAERELDIIRAQYKVLVKRCSHPDEYRFSIMGETSTKCPDCRHAT